MMIREDANGKEYNDYQLLRRNVYRTRSGGLIGCDAEMHLMFVIVLKKLFTADLAHTHTHTAAGLASATFLDPFRCCTAEKEGSERQEGMNLPPDFTGLQH